MQIFLSPSRRIELRLGEYLPGCAGHTIEHGILPVVETSIPAGHLHPAVLVIDLQFSDAQPLCVLTNDIGHLFPLILQCIHDGLKHAAVRILSPDDNDLLHAAHLSGRI